MPTFAGLFGDPGPEGPGTFFFLRLLAVFGPEGLETPVDGWQGRNTYRFKIDVDSLMRHVEEAAILSLYGSACYVKSAGHILASGLAPGCLLVSALCA